MPKTIQRFLADESGAAAIETGLFLDLAADIAVEMLGRLKDRLRRCKGEDSEQLAA